MSGKLTVTGKAIWYLTYKVMCEDSFVFKCLGKYHYKHRPNFIRALPIIQVLPNSPDHSVVPLAGDRLLDFLLKLDGAISSKVKSIFNSCWSEVPVFIEEGGLNAVSCKDLIDVLNTAGIPQLALSAMVSATVAERKRNKSIGKCTTSVISVTGLTHPLPSSSQSLSLQSNPELSPRTHSQPESQLSSSLPLMEEAPGTSSEVDSDDGSSSNKCVDLLGV
ncbi:hypothetical protein, partial [Candidatus Ichthyocystis sparus]|uniref:hypothetical protein n=1 Tax=Candidatus Ichthyocystis sparus TaxID=1561004 RepID=UPI000B0D3E0F